LDTEQVRKILYKIHAAVAGTVQLIKVSLSLSIYIAVLFYRVERVDGRWLNTFRPVE
jgi:hypothetical protein